MVQNARDMPALCGYNLYIIQTFYYDVTPLLPIYIYIYIYMIVSIQCHETIKNLKTYVIYLT